MRVPQSKAPTGDSQAQRGHYPTPEKGDGEELDKQRGGTLIIRTMNIFKYITCFLLFYVLLWDKFPELDCEPSFWLFIHIVILLFHRGQFAMLVAREYSKFTEPCPTEYFKIFAKLVVGIK